MLGKDVQELVGIEGQVAGTKPARLGRKALPVTLNHLQEPREDKGTTLGRVGSYTALLPLPLIPRTLTSLWLSCHRTGSASRQGLVFACIDRMFNNTP